MFRKSSRHRALLRRLRVNMHVLLRPCDPHPARHAILRPQADGIGVEDLGSLNGSFVNEDRLEGTVVIRGGDVLQVGQTVVKITC